MLDNVIYTDAMGKPNIFLYINNVAIKYVYFKRLLIYRHEGSWLHIIIVVIYKNDINFYEL